MTRMKILRQRKNLERRFDRAIIEGYKGFDLKASEIYPVNIEYFKTKRPIENSDREGYSYKVDLTKGEKGCLNKQTL